MGDVGDRRGAGGRARGRGARRPAHVCHVSGVSLSVPTAWGCSAASSVAGALLGGLELGHHEGAHHHLEHTPATRPTRARWCSRSSASPRRPRAPRGRQGERLGEHPGEGEVVQRHEAPSGPRCVVNLGEGPGSVGVLGRSTQAVGGSTRARWCSSAGWPRWGRGSSGGRVPRGARGRFPSALQNGAGAARRGRGGSAAPRGDRAPRRRVDARGGGVDARGGAGGAHPREGPPVAPGPAAGVSPARFGHALGAFGPVLVWLWPCFTLARAVVRRVPPPASSGGRARPWAVPRARPRHGARRQRLEVIDAADLPGFPGRAGSAGSTMRH